MKRIVCLLLALIMMLSVFVSCENADGIDSANEGSSDIAYESEENTEPESEETTEAETEAPAVMNGYDLSSFKIVYSGSHLADIAEEFKTKLNETAKIELEVVLGDDIKDEGGCEFIIGNSDRDISGVCFGDYTTFKYSASKGIYCDNGKVQILGIDRTTIRDSIKYFFENVVTEETKTIAIPEEGAICTKIDLASVDLPAKADPSYIRVVTNNILMHSVTDNKGVPVTQNRISELVGTYALLDADIFMFQEVDKPWYNDYSLVKNMKSLGYSYVRTSQITNPVALFYKTSRFKLVQGDFVKYDSSMIEGGPYSGRYYTWACLEEKETGKQIVVTSTHFVAGITGVDAKYTELYRQESAKQLAAFAQSIKSKYPNAVVIMGGDYNSNLESESYRIMSESLLSARDTAEKTVNMLFQTTCTLGQKPTRGNSPKVIDHIFYSKTGLTAKHYEVVVARYTYAYSDHVPVLVDFELN